jgi:hypothetical protein
MSASSSRDFFFFKSGHCFVPRAENRIRHIVSTGSVFVEQKNDSVTAPAILEVLQCSCDVLGTMFFFVLLQREEEDKV